MKTLLKLFLMVVFSLFLAGARFPLEKQIQNKNFSELEKICSDRSWLDIKNYFLKSEAVKFSPGPADNYYCYVKFSNHAEISLLSFKKKHHKFSELKLTRLMFPLDYISGFRATGLQDRTFVMGDGRIVLRRGRLFQARPFGRLLLFAGKGGFSIQPADAEEQLTLQKLYKSPELKRNFPAVLMLADPGQTESFREAGIESFEEIASVEELKNLLVHFNEQFGIQIRPFGEYWYPRFSRELMLAVFSEKKKSRLQFQYNGNLSPDSTLVVLPEHKYLLSYNRVRGMKLRFSTNIKVRKNQVNLFINPSSNFIWGTGLMIFAAPSDLIKFRMREEIKLLGVKNSKRKELDFFTMGNEHFVRGEKLDRVITHFSGKFPSQRKKIRSRHGAMLNSRRHTIDNIFIWSRDELMYPSPLAQDFLETTVGISVPEKVNCLSSGGLVRQKVRNGRRRVLLKSPSTKGIGMVFGKFTSRWKIDGPCGLEVFSDPGLPVSRYFSREEMKEALTYFCKRFGLPTSRTINLVLRRWTDFGGLSYQGLIVQNLLAVKTDWTKTTRRYLARVRPTVFTDVNRDNFVHELAHQWWGGEISWKTYRDIWITEGLAQYSLTSFLEKRVSARKFKGILDQLKRWAVRKSDFGPVIYGPRILNLYNDYNAFQGVVYNKSALIFLMLEKMLGEKEFDRRLQHLLDRQRYKSLTSRRFADIVSQKNDTLKRFFDFWLYSRKIPKITFIRTIQGKHVSIELKQDSAAVFPLRVVLRTLDGNTLIKNVIMEKKTQVFSFSEESNVKEVELDSWVSPVRL